MASTIRPHPPPKSTHQRTPLVLARLDARSLAIVLGQSDDYTRFRFALDHAGPQPGSLRDLADRLGTHPSALSRSNFTLSSARRRQAAVLLDVPPGFLDRTWTPPQDLPAALEPLHAVMEHLRQALTADGVVLDDGWIRDARLAGLTKDIAQAALPEQPAEVVTRLVQLCRELGRRQLDQRHDLTLTSRDCLLVVDALVDQALCHGAGNLHHPAFVLARRLVRQFDDGSRP